jgi:dTDP-4-amino-4,6-dideoxygalactose transaminase
MRQNKRIFLSPPHMGGAELEYIREAFEANYIAPTGPQVDAFEQEFARYTGISHAAAVSCGTAAMHLALRLLGVGPGDEVFASSLTFLGSVSPIVFQGATPVFIDSDSSSFNMDPDLLGGELKRCAKSGTLPKAVAPTDLYGQSADMQRILEICGSYDVPVVADSAEALGASCNGRHAGAGARLTVFSFNGNKIITTSGGGMLASDDGEVIRQARFLSQQAREPAPHYERLTIGYNYRMSNILAAVGLGQLKVLDERVAKKREIFEGYRQRLGDLPGIEFMPEAPYGRSSRWLSVLLLAGPRFAQHENRCIRAPGHPLDQMHHVLNDMALADEAGNILPEDLLLEGLDLLPHSNGLQCIGDPGLQGITLKGLDHVVVGAQLHGGYDGFGVLISRAHDHEDVRMLILDDLQGFHAAHSGQSNIQEDEIRHYLFKGFQRFPG